MSEVKLVGAFASPYSRKMRALLRYRRIPFRWILRGSPADLDTPAVPVTLIPVLVLPSAEGDTAMIDSTFQIRRLESAFAERAVTPADPAVAFLDALVEDYADEWLTKAMFHYRWAYAADAAKAAHVLPCDMNLDVPPDQLARAAQAFGDRQIGRLGVVGSNAATGPLIEASYRRLLAVLDAHVQRLPFLFGRRPSAADFALFGQLSQLALFDPTPAALAAAVAPRVVAWVNHLDDLGGIDVGDDVGRDGGHDGANDVGNDVGNDGWSPRATIGTMLRPLFVEIGRVYAPFLVANAAALATGAAQVECRIDATPWVQTPFPYQAKCLRWLREHYAGLAAADRAFIDATLAGTGCEPLCRAS